jgi:hypothetical protein
MGHPTSEAVSCATRLLIFPPVERLQPVGLQVRARNVNGCLYQKLGVPHERRAKGALRVTQEPGGSSVLKGVAVFFEVGDPEHEAELAAVPPHPSTGRGFRHLSGSQRLARRRGEETQVQVGVGIAWR